MTKVVKEMSERPLLKGNHWELSEVKKKHESLSKGILSPRENEGKENQASRSWICINKQKWEWKKKNCSVLPEKDSLSRMDWQLDIYSIYLISYNTYQKTVE